MSDPPRPKGSPPARERPLPLEALGRVTSRIAGRFVPDAFVLAIGLTLLTLLLSLGLGRSLEGAGLSQRLTTVVVDGFMGGFTSKGGLQFAFQMVLVLVTGFAFAMSPPVQRLIDAVARLPRTSAQASAVVGLTACLAGYIHWGLGAVAGAMLAREIARSWHSRNLKFHYPLLGAAAYTGLLVWHGGLSGSAPLTVAAKDHFLIKSVGIISVEQTLFSPLNLVVTSSLIVVTVALCYLLTPPPDQSTPWEPPKEPVGSSNANDKHDTEESLQHPAIAWLEGSAAVPFAFGVLALTYLTYDFATNGYKALNLNTVNLGFFTLGLLLHGSPRSYLAAAAEGARGSVGIILQFPLYFGILGMLKSSGLILQISDLFVGMSTPQTLPVFTYLSGGLVNLLVPSGGGQWAIQGPIMMDAARTLGVEPAKVIMALAYGDAWTNMLQPFWALPLLGIMGLKARDIIGYTTLFFLVSGPLTICLLLLM